MDEVGIKDDLQATTMARATVGDFLPIGRYTTKIGTRPVVDASTLRRKHAWQQL